jgi:hypothetical protein
MGSSTLLDPENLEKNRIVEVWGGAPLSSLREYFATDAHG